MTTQWSNDMPIYLQLYQQVIERILDGVINEGEALPSVRTVAAEYRLNPLTISKAYQMLQEEGIVEKQRGKGLFIRPGTRDEVLQRERQNFLQQEWPAIVRRIERLALTPDKLLNGEQERSV